MAISSNLKFNRACLDASIVSFIHVLLHFPCSLTDQQTKRYWLLSPPTESTFSVFLQNVQEGGI